MLMLILILDLDLDLDLEFDLDSRAMEISYFAVLLNRGQMHKSTKSCQ